MRRVALIATLALASCGGGGGETERATTAPPEPPKPDSREVVLTLEPDSPHAGDTVTLTVHNRTRWRLEYGVAYRLERRVDGEWRWINRDSAFILLLKFVEPGGREREEISLGHLEPGRYRIVKSFMAPDAGRRFKASVEFSLSGL
jgi:hypothetical protein